MGPEPAVQLGQHEQAIDHPRPRRAGGHRLAPPAGAALRLRRRELLPQGAGKPRDRLPRPAPAARGHRAGGACRRQVLPARGPRCPASAGRSSRPRACRPCWATSTGLRSTRATCTPIPSPGCTDSGPWSPPWPTAAVPARDSTWTCRCRKPARRSSATSGCATPALASAPAGVTGTPRTRRTASSAAKARTSGWPWPRRTMPPGPPPPGCWAAASLAGQRFATAAGRLASESDLEGGDRPAYGRA